MLNFDIHGSVYSKQFYDSELQTMQILCKYYFFNSVAV